VRCPPGADPTSSKYLANISTTTNCVYWLCDFEVTTSFEAFVALTCEGRIVFFKSSISFALAPLGRGWQRYFFPSCLHIHTNTHDSLKTITKLPLQVYTTLHIICTVFASLIWAVNYFESPASKYIFASNVCTYMHKKGKKKQPTKAENTQPNNFPLVKNLPTPVLSCDRSRLHQLQCTQTWYGRRQFHGCR